MRISKDADSFLMVKTISAVRDNDPKSKTNGKMIYTTEDTIKVFDATPEAVSKVIMTALENASSPPNQPRK